jgi:purine-binding chemotaxis protein CheW
MSESRQLCTFHLGSMFFGIDVLNVQEVLRFQQMTKVPLAPVVIRGLINLRGQIVAAIDLRERLGLKPREDGVDPMNVIVRTEDGAISLLVDEIGDVLEIDTAGMDRPPETVRGSARDLIQGVYKLKDRLLLILDTEKTVNMSASAGK